MKKIIIITSILFSFNSFSQTDFSAVIIKNLNILSISVSDDGRIPPFEGGMLWSSIKGLEQRKYIDENGFSMECDGLKSSTNDVFGSCTLNIPMKGFQKIGAIQVYKLTGISAAKLNRYFNDSAYVSIQGGRVYLSSYNTRREFFFGINDSLIKR